MNIGTIALAAAIALLPCAFAGFAMGMAIQSILIMGLALTESCAIYGFVTALIMIFTMR